MVSASADCRAKPRQRLPQTFVCDLRDGRGDPRRCNGIGSRGWSARASPQRRLPQHDPLYRAPAEEAIDAFADHIGKMLDLDRRRSFDPQNKRAGGAP